MANKLYDKVMGEIEEDSLDICYIGKHYHRYREMMNASKKIIIYLVTKMREKNGMDNDDKIYLFWDSDDDFIKDIFADMHYELKQRTNSIDIIMKCSEDVKSIGVNGRSLKLSIKLK